MAAEAGRDGMARAADGVALWWALAGRGPTVVLIPGRGDSSDLYPIDFTDALEGAGLSVLRFDPRDTGSSGDGGDRYRLSDMADDVVTVCDAARVGAVHVMGVSMGGMIAVDLVSRRPGRVRSLTFLAAMSPDPTAGVGPAFFDGIAADPVHGTLAAMGAPTAPDEAWVRSEVERSARHAPPRPDAGARHQAAAERLGWPELAALEGVHVPALVVHGTDDQVLPTAHATALANGIASSARWLIDGMGHLPTRREWLLIAQRVAAHVRAVET